MKSLTGRQLSPSRLGRKARSNQSRKQSLQTQSKINRMLRRTGEFQQNSGMVKWMITIDKSLGKEVTAISAGSVVANRTRTIGKIETSTTTVASTAVPTITKTLTAAPGSMMIAAQPNHTTVGTMSVNVSHRLPKIPNIRAIDRQIERTNQQPQEHQKIKKLASWKQAKSQLMRAKKSKTSRRASHHRKRHQHQSSRKGRTNTGDGHGLVQSLPRTTGTGRKTKTDRRGTDQTTKTPTSPNGMIGRAEIALLIEAQSAAAGMVEATSTEVDETVISLRAASARLTGRIGISVRRIYRGIETQPALVISRERRQVILIGEESGDIILRTRDPGRSEGLFRRYYCFY